MLPTATCPSLYKNAGGGGGGGETNSLHNSEQCTYQSLYGYVNGTQTSASVGVLDLPSSWKWENTHNYSHGQKSQHTERLILCLPTFPFLESRSHLYRIWSLPSFSFSVWRKLFVRRPGSNGRWMFISVSRQFSTGWCQLFVNRDIFSF